MNRFIGVQTFAGTTGLLFSLTPQAAQAARSFTDHREKRKIRTPFPSWRTAFFLILSQGSRCKMRRLTSIKLLISRATILYRRRFCRCLCPRRLCIERFFKRVQTFAGKTGLFFSLTPQATQAARPLIDHGGKCKFKSCKFEVGGKTAVSSWRTTLFLTLRRRSWCTMRMHHACRKNA